MTEKLIEIDVYPKELKLKPGESTASFEVTAINASDRYASFQLEVLASGADSNLETNWYRISPEVSAKKPPGDSTQFQVTIKDTPVPGFVGVMNLTVRVFSVELSAEDRQVLRLALEPGNRAAALKLQLPDPELEVFPGNQVKITVSVSNPSQKTTLAVLTCLGLESAWLVESNERRLKLRPAEKKIETFTCQIPPGISVESKFYSFIIEGTHQYGPPSQVQGTIQVLPVGKVKFLATPERHHLPAKWAWIPNWRSPKPVTYFLDFENASNLSQSLRLEIEGKDREKCSLETIPSLVSLEHNQTTQVKLVANAKRHWWGFTQKLKLITNSVLSDPRLNETEPTSKTLELWVKPIIPLWLQVVPGLLLLTFLIWLWMYLDSHLAPVRSVKFNGLADWVVSGSDDQTIRLWQVQGNNIKPSLVLGKNQINKAVRVVRYRPLDNNIVAVGLENGQIQLWDLLSRKAKNLVSERDDRVFGLEFTKDSRYLFSGHGNNVVLQWDLQNIARLPETSQLSPIPHRPKIDFTVSDIALVGNDSKYLAIAGRFNQLALWDWTDKTNVTPRTIPYFNPGGQDDYITSISVASNNPNLMAVADNQGNISLWNLSQCLADNKIECQKLDSWSVNSPVRSLAISANGCYLASVGDDRNLMLWPLSSTQQRSTQFVQGIKLKQFEAKLNSVDLKLVGKDILIVTGDDDYEVKLYRTGIKPETQCELTQ